MRGLLVSLCLVAACRSDADLDGFTAVIPTDPASTGFATGPWATPTATTPEATTAYDDAYVRIVSPVAGEVVPWGVASPFEVVVYDGHGGTLPADSVRWFASEDPDFHGEMAAFDSDMLGIGTHEITVIVDAPNGNVLAHSIGGVRVQSGIAGTYAGLFSVDGSVGQITISCTGAAVVQIGVTGEAGSGSGDCLVSILALDVPMTWDFSLSWASGVLTGEASVNLIGFFSYDVPMTEGTVEPNGVGLDLTYAGNIPLVGTVSAFLEAPRISLEAE